MLRRRVGWVFVGVGAVLAALLVFGSLAGPRLARSWLQTVVRDSSGLDVRIGRVSAGIRPLGLGMYDVRLMNPAEFGPGEALVIRELRVELPWRAVWRREPTLDLVRFDVPSLVIERRAGGTSNWQRIQEIAFPRLRPAADRDPRPPSPPEPPSPAGSPPPPPSEQRPAPRSAAPVEDAPPLRISRLHLQVGVVEIREVRPDRPQPKVQRLELNLDQSWTNVTDLSVVGAELAGVVMIRSAPILLNESVAETVGEGAARAMDKLERKAARLLEKLGAGGEAATNLIDQGLEELRKALPGKF